MPIKGLKIVPSFPMLGRVRKGAPYTKEDQVARRRMEDLTFFRLDTDREDVRAAWLKVLGERPERLHIIFPHAEMERCWDYWQVEFDTRGLVHRCDGETIYRWRTENGTYSEERKPCPYWGHPELRTKQRPGCKPQGQLRFIIKEMLAQGFVGYFELVTGSWTDIRNITACLEQMTVTHRVTDLTGLECDLYRKEEEIGYIQDGVRKTSRHHVVYLEPSAEWVLRRMAQERARLLALPEPELVVDTETGVVLDAQLIEAGDEQVAESVVEPAVPPAVPPAVQPAVEPAVEHRAPVYQRPYEPETLKKAIAQRAAKGSPVLAAAGLRGACLGAAEALFAGDRDLEEKRHRLMEFLFGIKSTKEMTDGQARAFLQWAQDSVQQDGITRYFASEMAMKEAAAVIAQEKQLSLDEVEEVPW